METQAVLDSGIKYPTLVKRFQSVFIDTFIILIGMLIFAAILGNFDNAPDWLRAVLFIGLWFIYEPVCMTLGGTLGNRILKLRVLKHNTTNDRINLFQAYIRFAVKILLGWLSFITIHMNSEKRAIHDFAANSIMIQLKK